MSGPPDSPESVDFPEPAVVPLPLPQAFAFCPRCGTAREGERGNPLRCRACGYTHYFGPVAAVASVVFDAEGRVLFLTRANDPHAGKLGLPGGFVDPGESAEEAARREAREEIGAELGGLTFLASRPNDYAYSGVLIKTVDVFFAARLADGQTVDANAAEVSQAEWLEPTDAVIARMAFESNKAAVRLAADRVP